MDIDWIIERVANEQYRWSRHGDREDPFERGNNR